MVKTKQVLQQEAYRYPVIPPLENIGLSDASLEPPFISEYFDRHVPI